MPPVKLTNGGWVPHRYSGRVGARAGLVMSAGVSRPLELTTSCCLIGVCYAHDRNTRTQKNHTHSHIPHHSDSWKQNSSNSLCCFPCPSICPNPPQPHTHTLPVPLTVVIGSAGIIQRLDITACRAQYPTDSRPFSQSHKVPCGWTNHIVKYYFCFLFLHFMNSLFLTAHGFNPCMPVSTPVWRDRRKKPKESSTFSSTTCLCNVSVTVRLLWWIHTLHKCWFPQVMIPPVTAELGGPISTADMSFTKQAIKRYSTGLLFLSPCSLYVIHIFR